MPAAVYVLLGVAPLPVVPSPKLHAYEAIVPSASLEAAPLNVTAVPTVAVAGPVNCATGGWLGAPPLPPPIVSVSSTTRTESWKGVGDEASRPLVAVGDRDPAAPITVNLNRASPTSPVRGALEAGTDAMKVIVPGVEPFTMS